MSVVLGVVAGTPAQEKAFTDKYKAALEGKDTSTLESFLYTQGSDPQALEFYKMMQSGSRRAMVEMAASFDTKPEVKTRAASLR